MLAVTFYDVVLWVHITAVVVAFGGVFTYPLWFAHVARAPAATRAGFHRGQAKVGKYVISPGLLVVLLAGAYLATDRDLWSEVWVTVPLVILIVLGGLGGAYFGPREERLAELAEAGDDTAYRPVFAQVRAVSYIAMALVVVAIFFMVTKLGA
jgi:uncharacterized membrane protein